ncbi:MAG: alkaline phosphatase D family protein [Acidobacteria bacterium]|nr:alkaline phosphatase D family protein [Acidobacteriota bacterium]
MSTAENRRKFLARTGAWFALTALNPCERVLAAAKFPKNPFTLGVASGDPTSTGVVLWTRLAQYPIHGGGMNPEAVAVDYRVASDEKMANIVRKGKVTASPDLAHSVHVDVTGLKPGAWYYYQFSAGGWDSPVARTRTAPEKADKLRFAFASCQHFETGYYTAYQHMAEEDLDLVIHLGDYIYEGGIGTQPGRPRKHTGAEILSITDYRNRHALYKTDELLQRTHQRFPWIVTWDDHEVDNDYANDFPEDGMPRTTFLERRASAYQAYYEHMPLRRTSMPSGSNMQLYRRLRFGQLGEIFVLDTRQYRSRKPCGAGVGPLCPEALAPGQSILGAAQRQWLLDGLAKSPGHWNIIANQVMMAWLDRKPGPEIGYSMDKWTGYAGELKNVMEFMAAKKVKNLVTVTGDIHSNWAADLKVDFANPKSQTVGVEFVGTSISSAGDGEDAAEEARKAIAENPHIHFHNRQRGYVSCTVTPGQVRADYRIVPYVSKPGAPLQTRASYVVLNGKPGLQKA